MSDRTTDDRTADDRSTERAETYTPNPGERGKWLSAIIALLGLWMLAEALWLDLVPAQFWNDVIVGLLLLAVGAYNYSRRASERLGNVAAASLAALLGLWLIAAPFVFGADTGLAETTNDMGFWNDIAVGALTFLLGAYSAYKARDRQADRETRRTAG